jgi:hypothetical protein
MIWEENISIENIIEIVSSIEPDVAEQPEKSPNNRSSRRSSRTTRSSRRTTRSKYRWYSHIDKPQLIRRIQIINESTKKGGSKRRTSKRSTSKSKTKTRRNAKTNKRKRTRSSTKPRRKTLSGLVAVLFVDRKDKDKDNLQHSLFSQNILVVY